MATVTDIESQLLCLPPAERARLLLRAWESLADDPVVAADPELDASGLAMALARDAELDGRTVIAIDHAEFRRRTGGGG